MKLLVVACLIAWLALPGAGAHAQPTERDNGPIIRSTPITITVNGAKGRHVLVPTKVCEWCKRGKRVVVTFEAGGKASLAPDPDFWKSAVLPEPIPALIVEQGHAQR
ncbi:MAG: hypothetical protein LDL33_15915 [Desulfomonile sp.]|nr:hypothetical protein [Desulfomonile sp.]